MILSQEGDDLSVRLRNMEYISRDISNDDLFDVARKWILVLASGDYQKVIDSIGYGMSSDPHVDDIAIPLRQYRSSIYPNETDFRVSDWRCANGGNPSPTEEIVWYEPNEVLLTGAVSMDLPLNGKWSDLPIDFVLFDAGDEGHLFQLEEIRQR